MGPTHTPDRHMDVGTHRSCCLTRLGFMHSPPAPAPASQHLHFGAANYGTDNRVHVTTAPDPHPHHPGADVTLTDVKEVLPLLRRNYEQNLSPAAIRGGGRPLLGQGGPYGWTDGYDHTSSSRSAVHRSCCALTAGFKLNDHALPFVCLLPMSLPCLCCPCAALVL